MVTKKQKSVKIFKNFCFFRKIVTMKFLKTFLLFWGCLSCAHCYFYPLCSSDDDSCTGYFKLPDSLESLFTYKPQIEYKDESVQDTRLLVFQGFTDTVMEKFFVVLAPVTDFYVKNVVPILKEIEKAAKNSYTIALKYVPMYKEKEKLKSSSNLYIFFILGSLTVYLLLYVYFTRKLYFYYKSSLRLEYLNKVKKIFQVKEKK